MGWTWKTKKCVLCRNSVRGRIGKVALSILCKHCCKKVQSESVSTYITEETALRMYGWQKMDLLPLGSTNEHYTVDERIHYSRRLFLTAEVAHLKKARLERLPESAEMKRLRRHMMKRKRLLLKKLKIGKKQFSRKEDRILWIVALGDYLKGPLPKTTFEDVQKRVAVLPRVREIRQRRPGIHPEAAFDFCLMYPNAGLVEFQELMVKRRQIFRIEGRRILQHLTRVELTNLQGTHLLEDMFISEEYKIQIERHLSEERDLSLDKK